MLDHSPLCTCDQCLEDYPLRVLLLEAQTIEEEDQQEDQNLLENDCQ